MSTFSGLADMDYIAPAQACIKPELVRKQRAARGGVGIHGIDEPEEPVKITLQDCLACSGCVTTAETMLVTSQSRPQIESVLSGADENTPQPWSVIVSVSDQSAASLAAHAGVPMEEAFQLVSGFVRATIGAQHVTDMRWAQLLSLDETATEFLQRLNTGSQPLPLMVSACPGWVCYCEKTHPTLLPHMCDVMSPQAIAGRYVKQCVAGFTTRPPADVDPSLVTATDLRQRTYHISVQPCFDRKLEAARGDFAGDDYARDTDCVLGTQELLDWMNDVDPSLPWRADLDSAMEPLRPPEATSSEATGLEGSGGYHQHVLARVAEMATGSRPSLAAIAYQQKRNANHRIAALPELQLPGADRPLTFGVVYGFQHIQNLVRSLKRKTSSTPDYAFIEVMACPEGSLNGGGQIRSGDRTRHHERLRAVMDAFERFTAIAAEQSQGGGAEGLFTTTSAWRDWLGPPDANGVSQGLRTTLHDRQAEMQLQDTVAASLRW
jgi:iron only hydrogenase large subunit-like protein